MKKSTMNALLKKNGREAITLFLKSIVELSEEQKLELVYKVSK